MLVLVLVLEPEHLLTRHTLPRESLVLLLELVPLVLDPEHLLTRHTLRRESLVLVLELVLALVLLLSWPRC